MTRQATNKAARVDVAAIRSALRRRSPVPDEEFDRLYPASERCRSEIHWTPVNVAVLVGEWLAAAPGGNILDVGSGVGKACHVGALASEARWCGVERDPEMVRIAARTARELAIEERTHFIHGEALQLDWSRFGGIYLFNPFTEALYGDSPSDPLVRQAAFVGEVLGVERKLLTLYPGARVVTYHGFGGEMPIVFQMVDRVEAYGGFACLWIRRPSLGS